MKTYGKNIFYVLMLLLCMASCRTIQEPINEMVVDYIECIDKSSLLDSTRVVKPSSMDSESIIGNVWRILASNDRIFIVDRKNNKLLCYDNDGNFIKSTESLIGKGKDEYIRIFDAAIDPNEGVLYVYFDAPYRMMTFDMNLNRINTYQLNEYYFEIAISGNSLYALCLSSDDNGMELRRFDKHNPCGEYQVLLTQNEFIKGIWGLGKWMTSDDKNCWVALPFSNKIYSIRDTKILSENSINFGDRWFDYGESKNLNLNSFFNYNDNKIWMIYNIVTSDSLLLFNTNEAGLVSAVKETRRAILNLELHDEEFPLVSSLIYPVGGLSNTVAMVVSPSLIKHYKEGAQKRNYKIELANKRNEQIINEYQESDNPLIVISKIK